MANKKTKSQGNKKSAPRKDVAVAFRLAVNEMTAVNMQLDRMEAESGIRFKASVYAKHALLANPRLRRQLEMVRELGADLEAECIAAHRAPSGDSAEPLTINILRYRIASILEAQ